MGRLHISFRTARQPQDYGWGATLKIAILGKAIERLPCIHFSAGHVANGLGKEGAGGCNCPWKSPKSVLVGDYHPFRWRFPYPPPFPGILQHPAGGRRRPPARPRTSNTTHGYPTLSTSLARTSSSTSSAFAQPTHVASSKYLETPSHASSSRPAARWKSSAARAWRMALARRPLPPGSTGPLF